MLPGESGWRKLLNNSHRVLHLILPKARSGYVIGEKALSTIARTRPVMEIFSNLKVLTCNLSRLDPTIMSRSVVEIHIIVDVEATPKRIVDVETVFSTVHHRMPNIERVYVEGTQYYHGFEMQFTYLVSGLHNVVGYERPSTLLTPSSLLPLSALPLLQRLVVSRSASDLETFRIREGFMEDRMIVKFRVGAFPSLRFLEVNARSVSAVVRILEDENFPAPSLVHIWVNFIYSEETSGKCIQNFMAVLVSRCPHLETLVIRFSDGAGDMSPSTEPYHRISFENIRRFLSLQNLTTFSIDHRRPIEVNITQAKNLAYRAHRFHTLWLNPSPIPELEEGLPLEVLLWFARYCPRMRRLGLFLDVSFPVFRPYSKSRFRHLDELFVGSSPLSMLDSSTSQGSWIRTGRLLSSILPARCRLSWASEWDLGKFDDISRRRLSLIVREADASNPWCAVLQFVHILMTDNVEVWKALEDLVADERVTHCAQDFVFMDISD